MSTYVIWNDGKFNMKDYQSKEQAYKEYYQMQGPRCIIHLGKVLETFGDKRCVGYGVEKGVVSFFSKDFRVLYLEDKKAKEIKDIPDEQTALKKYDSINKDWPRCIAKERKVLRVDGNGFDEYLLLVDLMYVNEDQKKTTFEIIKPDKAKLLQMEGKCKMCLASKAVVLHEKCAHLCYCQPCFKSKKDNICSICGLESRMIEVNIWAICQVSRDVSNWASSNILL